MAHGPYEKPIRPSTKQNVARLLKTDVAKFVRKFEKLVRRELWTKEDPGRQVDWNDPLVWEKINNEGFYHRADEMLVSCGTVTVDQADSPRPKVLVVFNKNIGIFQLPKGRKNFDERHLDTALRETTEEAGVAVQPLRLRFGSRSTPPKPVQAQNQARETRYGVEDKVTGITEGFSSESIGYVLEFTFSFSFNPHHSLGGLILILNPSDPDPATGAWRHIYWFAAKPLGDIKRDEARMTEEEDRKKFSTFWFSEMEALSRLKLEDEKFMVRIVFAYIRSMSDNDWTNSREHE
ncbi:uncharacterized protein GGS22DRAFT_187414 [Annulohypoxylon maeteangense]|uniref:uncharacterized protein n=1 Tax=Annulohypoxylon maeteangense TaxID=1927788 RepID=UPI0020079D0A|nr:uncharacterized protein GGS22DRAFT_187414 [Annulohypoxylon maeteangense]KAI0886179.1 hypothetical protein GGS22DRAFT_187414 [Annulohypoxylon maeteangense]